jgi:hypothetical protein
MSAMEERTLDATVMTRCNIPAGAKALALNVTAVSATTPGYISLYPGGVAWPGTWTVSSSTIKTRASAAITSLGVAGGLTMKNASSGTVDVVIDVSGYFH